MSQKRKKWASGDRAALQQAWGSRCACCSVEFQFLLPEKSRHAFKLNSNDRVFDLDHLEALEFGGVDELWNVWPLCPACHARKTRVEAQLGFSVCPKCDEKIENHRRRNLHSCIVNFRSVFHREIDGGDFVCTEIPWHGFEYHAT